MGVVQGGTPRVPTPTRVTNPPSSDQDWYQPGFQVKANWKLIARTVGSEMAPKKAKVSAGQGSSGVSHRAVPGAIVPVAPSTSWVSTSHFTPFPAPSSTQESAIKQALGQPTPNKPAG